MLVEKVQLLSAPYNVPEDLFFERRYGAGEPISRDQFFITNTSRLVDGAYCAIGNDVDGWELEQFDSNNWNTVLVDPNYALVITNEGLRALTYVLQGGYQLYFSGLKILDNPVLNPHKPLINWTDSDFTSAGNVVFSIGTDDAKYSSDDLNSILKWRYNTATGSLQYTFDLPNSGTGAKSDNGNTEWLIGAIGLYVKRGNQYVQGATGEDILFGVASLPSPVKKYADDVDMVGNTLRFHFNTVLNNLGYVANLNIFNENEQSIPEVPNESLLEYPYDPLQRPHNCYLVDNLFGTGIPALAVPRSTSENVMTPDWVYFQPSDNILTLPTQGNYFADDVKDYMFVYYCNDDGLYHKAEGEPEIVSSKEADSRSKGYNVDAYDPTNPSAAIPVMTTNTKMPIGMRVGNSIVYAGTITNKQENASYTYKVALANSGKNYRIGDELFLPASEGLIFKLIVTYVRDSDGAISSFKLVGPETGSMSLPASPVYITALYDSRSNLKYGRDARFRVTQVENPQYIWPLDSSWLNKPVYCGYGDLAGKPTLERTDSFLGWCTSTNSIQLALDLRNEASDAIYGTTRYATDCETRDSYKYIQAAHQTCLTPWTANTNYLQITKPELDAQPGKLLTNPIEIKTFTHFNEILIGKGVSSPYNEANNPYIEDESISFYGMSYRAWYKDIAEYYKSDAYYSAGTLITFGKGTSEISIADFECNGIISSKPGYQLGEKRSDLDLPVALVGRVPVIFDGNCFPHFGDKIYLSKITKGCASTVENGKCLGKVIDRNIGTKRLIECVVRIDF